MSSVREFVVTLRVVRPPRVVAIVAQYGSVLFGEPFLIILDMGAVEVVR
jgi:hypothetical protein